MISKSFYFPEYTNTISQFITISFPSENQSNKAPVADSNNSENTNSPHTLPNDQNPDNNTSQTHSQNDNVSNSHASPKTSSNQPEPKNQMPENHQPTPQRMSTHPIITRAKTGICKPKIYNTEKALSLETPSSVAKALNDIRWKNAMQEEFNVLTRNQTWCLVPPYQNIKLVENK